MGVGQGLQEAPVWETCVVWGDSGAGVLVCLQGVCPAGSRAFEKIQLEEPHLPGRLQAHLGAPLTCLPSAVLDSELCYLCPGSGPRPSASVCRMLAWAKE